MAADQVIVAKDAPRRSASATSGSSATPARPITSTGTLLGFERYELRRPTGVAARSWRIARAGFCLGDRLPGGPGTICQLGRRRRSTPAVCEPRASRSASAVREGISVGYGDDYEAAILEGQ